MLARRPLAGGGRPLLLPDLERVLGPEAVTLSDEHLAGPVAPAGLPKPLRVLDPAALHAAARAEGEIPYLRFQPPEVGPDAVRLTLEARIAGPEERPELGLSGLQVTFRAEAGRWVAGEPAMFAA